MSSIIRLRDTYHGISVFGRGVFTNDKHGRTYAGQCKDGHACGLGVLTWSNGFKQYAEHGPDGQFDGRNLCRWAAGHTQYCLYERGEQKDSARVSADGDCAYNREDCAPDDPRLLALIALVAPVEVRPQPQPPSRQSTATRPQAQSSDGSAGSFCPRRRWRPPWPPRCTPTPHAVAGGCATQPNSSHTAKHVHTVTRTWAFLRYWSHGRHRLAPTNNRSLLRTKGPSRQRRCHAIVQHAAC
jgi:hypothetical protein